MNTKGQLDADLLSGAALPLVKYALFWVKIVNVRFFQKGRTSAPA